LLTRTHAIANDFIGDSQISARQLLAAEDVGLQQQY
jgi:hypothetical protein